MPCTRCIYRPATHGPRCEACDRYLRRTGRERPWDIIERAIDREIEREVAGR